MLTIVNSVDTGGAILAVLTARKLPFVLSLVAKCGVTEVAKYVIDRYELSEVAQNDMYRYFEMVQDFSPETVDVEYTVYNRVPFLMRVTQDVFGDCAFSIVVEKMEI